MTKLRYMMKNFQVEVDKSFANFQVLLKKRTVALCQHVQLEARAQSFKCLQKRAIF